MDKMLHEPREQMGGSDGDPEPRNDPAHRLMRNICKFCGTDKEVEAEVFSRDKGGFPGHSCWGIDERQPEKTIIAVGRCSAKDLSDALFIAFSKIVKDRQKRKELNNA